MKIFTLFLIVASFFGVVDAKFHSRTSVFGAVDRKKLPRSTNNKDLSDLLAIRGGGADPLSFVKPALAVGAAQGIVGCLSPSTHCELYGWDSSDPVQSYIAYYVNGAILISMATMFFQVFYGQSRVEAIGHASIVYAIAILNVILNKKYDTVGAPAGGPYFLLAMHAGVAYAGLTNAPFAEALVKGFGIFSFVNALGCLINPKMFVENAWGIKLSTRFQEDIVQRGLATALAAHGVCICLPAFLDDMDAMKTTGWMFLSWVPCLVLEFIKPNTIKDRPGSLLWIILDSLVGYKTLAQ